MEQNSSISNLVRKEFIRLHGANEKILMVRSPGRINLIGEHTDYNDGFVLPSAIDRAVYFAVAPAAGSESSITSLDFGESHRFDSRNPVKSDKPWANYLIGIVEVLTKAGHRVNGFNCVYAGDIPIGSGLSSSAAVEAGLAFALNKTLDLGIERVELARLAQKSENEFVGVRCGIMDQFANLLSRQESVLLLDCRSLEYEYIPFAREDLRFVLCDTGVKHSLAASEYNVRRSECEAGVAAIRNHGANVKSLREVTREELELCRDEMDSVVYKRCSYVLEENARVKGARNCLLQDDYSGLGTLMYASHEGLKSKYEVTCPELDLLVDATAQIDGVLGARMMGGGFGGCTLNLVQTGAVKEFKRAIGETYLRKIGRVPPMYECRLMPGTNRMNNHEE